MKKNVTAPIVLLAAFLVTIAVLLAMTLLHFRPQFLIIAFVILVILALLLASKAAALRRALAGLVFSDVYTGGEGQSELRNLKVPVAILSGKNIVWYNPAFENMVLTGKEGYLQSIYKLVPGFDLAASSGEGGQPVEAAGHRFTVYTSPINDKGGLQVAYFVEDTKLKETAQQVEDRRPAMLHILVDTYDDIIKDLRDTDRARLMSAVDMLLHKYLGKAGGFVERTGDARYLAIVEEKQLRDILEDRFSVLDGARLLGTETVPITLSVGAAHGFDTMEETDRMASAALDMSLGRGGDQAAVRAPEGFTFFGGTTKEVGKKSRVKSRVVAKALADLIHQHDKIFVMGHQNADVDSIAACAGLVRFVKAQKGNCFAVVDAQRATAPALLAHLADGAFARDMLEPEAALEIADEKSLLICVDFHAAYLAQSPELLSLCQHVAVIDHHRKNVDHITGAVLFHLEPYASSTSEMVTELLQYAPGEEIRPTENEAEALLAGIILDTKGFVLHSGVRTFEAAAYLRRAGAIPGRAMKLFSVPLSVYTKKAQLLQRAQIYRNSALVVAPEGEGLTRENAVAIPQAANDLLSLQGVGAAFVAAPVEGGYNISARSYGEVNVQPIMESLGGGGHAVQAAAQMKNATAAQVNVALRTAIDSYYDNNIAKD